MQRQGCCPAGPIVRSDHYYSLLMLAACLGLTLKGVERVDRRMRRRQRLSAWAVLVLVVSWQPIVLAQQPPNPSKTSTLTLTTRSSVRPPAGNGPVLGTLATKLDSLIPGASGVFLAEVAGITERDQRSHDGDLFQEVTLRATRASGLTRKTLRLVRAYGGLSYGMFFPPESLPPPPPKPRFSLKPDTLELGHRYWFATGSNFDIRYPQHIAGFWPVENAQIGEILERAVEQDAYAWHPETWPSGYLTGWFDDSLRSSSILRVWLPGRLLWEKRLEGLLTHSIINWYVHRGDELAFMRPPLLPDTAMVLWAEVRAVLVPQNSFGVPAGSYRIQHLMSMSSGRLVASRVRVDQDSDFECVYQSYDRKGRLEYERIQDYIKQGGRSFGGSEEAWIRRVDRWLNPRTGKPVREEVRRHAAPTSDGGEPWVLVDLKRGIAAGPLRGGSHP